MFGFQLFIARPSTWVRLSRDGRTLREGTGLSILRFRAGSTLVAVPLDLRELSFRLLVESVSSADAHVEGRLAWLIRDPETAAARLDFRVDSNGDPAGDGMDRLEALLREELRVALRATDEEVRCAAAASAFAASALATLRISSLLAALGAEPLALHVERVGSRSYSVDREAGAWTGADPSNPLAESWRRDLPMLIHSAPPLVGPAR